MIIAEFKEGQTRAYTKSMHQFDKGQRLVITGITLPETYEAHMSNEKDGEMSQSCSGDATGVLIPDVLFQNGGYIYVWLYGSESEDEGSTIGEIVIPIIKEAG